MRKGIKSRLDNLEKKLTSNSEYYEVIVYDSEKSIPEELLQDDSIQACILIPDNGRDLNFDQKKHYEELIKRSKIRRKELGFPKWKEINQGKSI